MITKMRPRYYCEHCKKASGSPSAMRRHEKGCTLNPQRVCGMCRILKERGGPEPSPPASSLVDTWSAHGFDAMIDAANNCPACTLAAIRSVDPCGTLAFDQAAITWRFKDAKERWWKTLNEQYPFRDDRDYY